jgi:hypothetical protein
MVGTRSGLGVVSAEGSKALYARPLGRWFEASLDQPVMDPARDEVPDEESSVDAMEPNESRTCGAIEMDTLWRGEALRDGRLTMARRGPDGEPAEETELSVVEARLLSRLESDVTLR